MSVEPSIGVAIALAVLVTLAVGASWFGRLRTGRSILIAAARAIVQLAAVSAVLSVVLGSIGWSLAFALFMFGVAVVTTSRRIGVGRAWYWAALAMAAGVVPVLVVIFASGAVPLTGAALVPFAGIVIGGTMNAHSLAGRRVFGALAEQRPEYEAALAIGLARADAVDVVALRHLPEALVPGMDQTRTVGLVTLPGAFIGVLLGGGSPVQAGIAQVLVLFGLLAAQTITVTVAFRFVRAGRLLPASLVGTIHE